MRIPLEYRPVIRRGVLLAAALTLAVEPACRYRRAPPPNVWAEVDGQPIYREQVERIYHRRSATGGEVADPQEMQSFELNILDALINRQILLDHAQQSGITVSVAEVDTQIAQMESPYSKGAFEKRLEAQGMDLAQLREEVRANLAVSKLMNRDITSHVVVTQAQIAAYYDRNKSNFDVPETAYHIAQILVTPGNVPGLRNLKNDDARDARTAARKIRALYARLKSGADFATLAENFSEDPRTASTGGDMGFVPLSVMKDDPRLQKAILSLKPGQMSGIIHTASGYHILKLLGIEQAGQFPLSDPEVQSTIRQTLTSEKGQLLKAAYIEALRDQAKVQNYFAEQILASVGVSPKPPLSLP